MNSAKIKNKGFTLVELLISMAIFVIFTGILINSYVHIVKSQSSTEDYRLLYSQARNIFDTVIFELRENVVDYNYSEQCPDRNGFNDSVDSLFLISKDAQTRKLISFDEQGVYMAQEKVAGNLNKVFSLEKSDYLNSPDIKVEKFHFFVSPKIDPYDLNNFDQPTTRFHPKVTVFGEFSRILSNGEKVDFKLQTTVSSRVYDQIYNGNCQI